MTIKSRLPAGFFLAETVRRRGLFVGDHLAHRGDTFLDPGDFFRPGATGFVRIGNSSGVFAFGFGKMVEQDIQSVLEGGSGHGSRLSLGTMCGAIQRLMGSIVSRDRSEELQYAVDVSGDLRDDVDNRIDLRHIVYFLVQLLCCNRDRTAQGLKFQVIRIYISFYHQPLFVIEMFSERVELLPFIWLVQ
jgi:hypothetical protein